MRKGSKDRSLIYISIFAAIIIFNGWLVTWYLLKDNPDRGTFGDMFGSVNAIFSGLALAGIIITILLQKNELRLQREELRETRKEFQTQNTTLKIQRFENTFFNMLGLHHQIVDGIDFRKLKYQNNTFGFNFFDGEEENENITLTGRDVFAYLYDKMRQDIEEGDATNVNKSYLEHYKKAQADFGHYFRNLYRIIKLVDTTDFNFDSSSNDDNDNFDLRYSYTSIVRAQLSDYELLWLFYNCLSKNGIEKFKGLIEKYTIFKNFPFDKLAQQSHRGLYEESAYTKPNQ